MVMMMDLDEDEYQHHSDGLDGASSLRRLNRLRESGTRSETGGVEGAPSATSTGATFAPTPGPLANPIASFPSFASSSASHSSFVGRPIDQEDIEVTSNNTILTTLSTHRHHSTHLPHIPTTEHNRSISIIPAPTSTLRPDQTGATADEHSEGGQKRLLSIKALLAQPPPYPHTSTSGLNRDNDDHNNDDHEGEKTKTRDYNYTRSSPSSGLELPIIRPSSITRKHRPQPIPTVPIPISTSPRPSSGPILNPQSYSASRRSPYPLSSLRDRFSHSASHSQSHSPFVNSAARSSPNSRAMSTTSLTPPPGGLTPPLQIQMDNHLEPSTSSYVPLASAPGSMSSRRRHAKPDWPSPKSSVRSSSSQRDRDRDRDREANPYSALQTPAILRVPATPFYSPAYRQASGSTAHPSLAHTNSAPGGVPTSPLPIPGIGAGTGVATRQDISIPATGRVHLTDVSKAHVIAALNKRAGQFWSSPESSDCRIFIPTPRRDNRSPKPIHTPQTVSALPVSTDVAAQPSSSDVPRAKDQGSGPPNAGETSDAGTGRGGSLPGGEDIPVMIFPLHRDYLITQSALLRHLLSAANPSIPPVRLSPTRRSQFQYQQSQPPLPPNSAPVATTPGTGLGKPKSPVPVPNLKGAKILPTKEGEPVAVYLPIPDPASFGVIVHWLYWGDTQSLESSLSRGLVTWQGVVKNIEYLALDDAIKRVMGKWWRRWVKIDVGREREPSHHNRHHNTYADASAPGASAGTDTGTRTGIGIAAGIGSAKGLGKGNGMGTTLGAEMIRKDSMISDSTGSVSEAGDDADVDGEDDVELDGDPDTGVAVEGGEETDADGDAKMKTDEKRKTAGKKGKKKEKEEEGKDDVVGVSGLLQAL